MITKNDIETIDRIKMFIDADEKDETLHRNMEWVETLERIVNNLKIAPNSYRFTSKEDKKNNYYTSECDKCGWWGSSKLTEGGGQIADTGDYDDVFCPVCGNYELEEKTKTSKT
jgi:predicted RNA-binding Zn-ribbon protein involved in translation (DUF1610 family)